MKPNTKITVLGAGSWGTALALQLAHNGHAVTLWGHNPGHIAELKKHRCNLRYLPDIPLPDNLQITDSLTHITADENILVATPSVAFASTLHLIKKTPWQQDKGLAWATKGLDPSSQKFLHEIAREILGDDTPLAVLSGPTFAKEVAQQLPTALTVAGTHNHFNHCWAQTLSSKTFRCYTSKDITGVEIAGASKNIIAIAAGVSDGLGFGSNARSAIITRGLREIMRLGTAYAANPHTFMGLAGVGDLSLTCSDDKSRNRQLGLLLAQGLSLSQAQAKINQAVEGATAAAIVQTLAQEKEVSMPITDQVVKLLQGEISPAQATENLLRRNLTIE